MDYEQIDINNINYSTHYCLVKTLARLAGFYEEEAQVIAEYSRFTDEFDGDGFLYFKEVPEYAQYLAAPVKGYWKFRCVLTGYKNLGVTFLKSPEVQKNRIVPFHYPTEEKMKAKPGKNRMFNKVKRPSRGKKSVLSSLMEEKKQAYCENADAEELVGIGILVHSFFSAVDHEYFSGFEGWENKSYLGSLYNNHREEEILLGDMPGAFAHKAAVGNLQIGELSEVPYYSYSMNQATNKDQISEIQMAGMHSRNNFLVYMDAAREVLDYFRACKDAGTVSEEGWGQISEKLRTVLLAQEDQYDKLTAVWKDTFGDYGIVYSYRKENILPKKKKSGIVMDDVGEKQIEVYTADDNFFRFNVYADQVRKAYLREGDF